MSQFSLNCNMCFGHSKKAQGKINEASDGKLPFLLKKKKKLHSYISEEKQEDGSYKLKCLS